MKTLSIPSTFHLDEIINETYKLIKNRPEGD